MNALLTLPSRKAGETVIVYAGPHYGRPHLVVEVRGRDLLVSHKGGLPFLVNFCDTEKVET